MHDYRGIVLGTFSRCMPNRDQAVLDAEAGRIAIIEKAKPAVLSIFEAQGRGGGSGAVISADGYAITNFHVVQPCGAAMKCGMADGRVYDAVLVGLDPTGDVALIKLFGRDDFPFAEMGDSDQVRAGRQRIGHGQSILAFDQFAAHGYIRHYFGRAPLPISQPAPCWNTPTACKPMPRSIRAIRAGRFSTRRAD